MVKQARKRLSMSTIAKETSIYNEFVEIPVTVQDEEYIIKLYPYFSNTKIRKLLEDVFSFIEKSKSEKIKIEEHEFNDIIFYFVVKHFTDIKMTASKKAKVIYDEYKTALNSDLFKVISQTIPEESMKKIYDQIYELNNMQVQLQKHFEKFQKDYKNLPLENRDIIEKTFGKPSDINGETV